MRLLTDIEKERTKLWSTLVSLLESGGDVRFYAAFLLGGYRFYEGAGPLARAILIEDKVLSGEGLDHRVWWWGRYPALFALIAIGLPAMDAVIDNLCESDDHRTRQLSTYALQRITFVPEGAQEALKNAIKAQKDPEKVRRLEAALADVVTPIAID